MEGELEKVNLPSQFLKLFWLGTSVEWAKGGFRDIEENWTWKKWKPKEFLNEAVFNEPV